MTPVYRNPSLDMKESATAAAPSAPKSSAESAAPASTPAKATSRASTTLLVGLDLGTNTSCLLAEPAGSKDISLSKIVPSIVGYAKDGLVEGIITNNAQVLFGEAAFAHRQQVNLVAPLENGIIAHREPPAISCSTCATSPTRPATPRCTPSSACRPTHQSRRVRTSVRR